MKTISLGPLYVMTSDGVGWMRLFGWGFTWADRKKHRPLFSERTGAVKVLRIGKWAFKTLKP